MNQAPLLNQIEVIEGNIRIYLMLLVIVITWGGALIYQAANEESPVTLEIKKTPEVQLQGIYINN